MKGRIDYVAPTTLAEESYEARRRPMPVGPAGIPIPFARAVYRPTVDAELLGRIGRAAYLDWSQAQTTRIEADELAAALLADLRLRYPADDMAVLVRYGFAEARSKAVVGTGAGGFSIALPESIDLPRGATDFRLTEEGTAAPLPAGFADYVSRRIQARERLSEGSTVGSWPSRFKAAEKRWPMWGEIEASFPIVADWMAAQRRGAR